MALFFAFVHLPLADDADRTDQKTDAEKRGSGRLRRDENGGVGPACQGGLGAWIGSPEVGAGKKVESLRAGVNASVSGSDPPEAAIGSGRSRGGISAIVTLGGGLARLKLGEREVIIPAQGQLISGNK